MPDGGVDSPQRDERGPDGVGLPLLVQDARQPPDPVLGRGIGRIHGQGEVVTHRADVDDPPSALGLHPLERLARAQEGARQVHVERLAPILDGRLLDRREDANPRAVDQQADGAQLLLHLLEHRRHGGLIRDVHPARVRRVLRDVIRGAHRVHALGPQPADDRRANVSGPANDDRIPGSHDLCLSRHPVRKAWTLSPGRAGNGGEERQGGEAAAGIHPASPQERRRPRGDAELPPHLLQRHLQQGFEPRPQQGRGRHAPLEVLRLDLPRIDVAQVLVAPLRDVRVRGRLRQEEGQRHGRHAERERLHGDLVRVRRLIGAQHVKEVMALVEPVNGVLRGRCVRAEARLDGKEVREQPVVRHVARIGVAERALRQRRERLGLWKRRIPALGVQPSEARHREQGGIAGRQAPRRGQRGDDLRQGGLAPCQAPRKLH
ncbi:conserved hypothetical protein [Stigmatella aurantiaca DW4/3-1]|uniref:Uncharacterized protein n=1 Tax=Stigmatella aurantiaca (strain DW4/3-1) TaxID=378806 RepID=Q099F7_STIAD|nr:conserved hypothetical protein [Stigmatella aurantiaca DW4/3-1]